MSDIQTVREGLGKLTKTLREKLLKNNYDKCEKLTQKQILDISWMELNEDDRKKFESNVTAKHIQSILHITNKKAFAGRALDRPNIKKSDLLFHLFDPTYKKAQRKTITKNMKEQSWKKWYGGQTNPKCYCCKEKDISPFDNQMGHVISVDNKGPTEVLNLIPICVSCNSAMSSTNMDVFMENQGYVIPEELKSTINELLNRGSPTQESSDNKEPEESEDSDTSDPILPPPPLVEDNSDMLTELSRISSYLERIAIAIENMKQ
jgi:hypothetical protein